MSRRCWIRTDKNNKIWDSENIQYAKFELKNTRFSSFKKISVFLFTEQKDDKYWENFQAHDLNEAVTKISTALELDLKPHEIQAETEVSKKKPKSFKSILNSSKKHLKEKSLATKESAQAFLKIHQSLSYATKEDILAVLISLRSDSKD